MVVTRRTPVIPAPTASRTSSSQPIPRSGSAKGKGAQINTETQETQKGREKANDDDDETPGKKGKKSKQKKEKKRKSKSNSFVDLLTRIFILCFTIYSLSVCPTDEKLQSPVCRGLSNYRRLVLDPYVLPAIQTALTHPSVSPYVERARPHVNRAVNIVTPVLARTHSEWTTRVVPQWNKRVVPQWNKFIVPQWNKFIVPQWNKHAAPHVYRVRKELEPYLTRLERIYTHQLAPYIKVTVYNLQRWQRKAQPYVVLAASKTYDGYQAAKPYARPLWNRIKTVVRQLLVMAQVQRRHFVDPHVARIWEKVKELSSGKPKISTMSFVPVSGTSDDHAVSITPVVRYPVDAYSSASASSSSIISTEPTPIVSATSTVFEDHPSPESNPALPTLLPDVPEYTSSTSINISSNSVEFLEPTSSTVSASVHETVSLASAAVSSTEDNIRSSTLSLVPSATSSHEVPESPTASPIATANSFSEQSDDEIDLDDFYAQLGLEDPVPSNTNPVESSFIPLRETETPEEKAERERLQAIEVAEKRADIMKRHKKWEDDLATLVKNKKKELRKTLVALRKPAAADLKENAEIRAQVENLVTEAEKFLKGAEVYLKNLKKEGGRDEDRISLWNRVVGKIETKFEEKLQETELVVNKWYAKHNEREIQEVWKIAAEVKDLAQRAQTDIGMDYAWLDDVTYDDWQRYHELLSTSDTFTDTAFAIQNGSHPSPPVNPIVSGVDDLQAEVQDVFIGFETRLRRIKRSGERAFGVAPVDTSDEEETIPDPEMSILPIPAGDSEEEMAYVPPVVIGRSSEEVVDAARRAEPQERSGGDAENSNQHPKKIAVELSQEPENADSSSGVVHVEL